MSEEYLPIKVVFPEQNDHVRPHTGGGKSKIFDEDDFIEHRDNIANEVDYLSDHFRESFTKQPDIPCVAKVKLRNDAIAKSHRPTRVLNERTCPIIGIKDLGELLISVDEGKLEKLKSVVTGEETDELKAQISAIEQILPYGPEDVIIKSELDFITESLKHESVPIKLKIFNHQNHDINNILSMGLNQILQEDEVDFEEVQYAENYSILKITKISLDTFKIASNYVGTQSISPLPYFSHVSPQFLNLSELDETNYPTPDPNIDYPIIGIIDSGIDPNNNIIKPWITATHSFVDESDRNYEHGTFVAGLCVHPKILNNNNTKFPENSAKIVDVIAIPDEDKGRVYEDQLIDIINTVVPMHPEVKIWNLSVGFYHQLCRDDKFSDFSIALDNIQKSNDIIFIISAGNYNRRPMRGWPRNTTEEDRIITPADSVMGITVGSLAHVENSNTMVKIDEPSPFTRHGPGPSFIPKPEISHYGGNCSITGAYLQSGILSLGIGNQLSECIGTSFSTPIVSNILANIIDSVNDDINISMAKALLIHSSVINSENLDAENVKYMGFGKPSDIKEILNCKPWSATMILDVDLIPGLEFHKWPFPIPDCLKNSNGTYRGDICMTLVYDPPLDAQYGAEYCRTNVDVSLGTYDLIDDVNRKHVKQIPLNPLDISELYEKHLIEHGFKWSPVKVYKRRLHRIKADTWRIYIKTQRRKEHTSEDPQPASLVITISDPNKTEPVYDQFIANINRLGWHSADLQIRDRIRTVISE